MAACTYEFNFQVTYICNTWLLFYFAGSATRCWSRLSEPDKEFCGFCRPMKWVHGPLHSNDGGGKVKFPQGRVYSGGQPQKGLWIVIHVAECRNTRGFFSESYSHIILRNRYMAFLSVLCQFWRFGHIQLLQVFKVPNPHWASVVDYAQTFSV